MYFNPPLIRVNTFPVYHSMVLPVLFCIYSVYIYKISRLKLTSARRDGGLFEQLECVESIRSRV